MLNNIFVRLTIISSVGAIIFHYIINNILEGLFENIIFIGCVTSYMTVAIYLSYAYIEIKNKGFKIITGLETRFKEEDFKLEKPKSRWDE